MDTPDKRIRKTGRIKDETATGTVFIVNDTGGFHLGIFRILCAAGYEVRAFDTAERFLEEQDCDVPGCLLLDIRLPGMSGHEMQRSLAGSARAHPIVILTAQGDIRTCVQAMKDGAVDFLTKPVDAARLIAAVDQAIRLDVAARAERTIRRMIEKRLQTLTSRERQVMQLVIRGHLNRMIGVELGVGEKTVKVHRGRIMAKMGARTVPELVQITSRVGILHDFRISTAVIPTARDQQTVQCLWANIESQSAIDSSTV